HRPAPVQHDEGRSATHLPGGGRPVPDRHGLPARAARLGRGRSRPVRTRRGGIHDPGGGKRRPRHGGTGPVNESRSIASSIARSIAKSRLATAPAVPPLYLRRSYNFDPLPTPATGPVAAQRPERVPGWWGAGGDGPRRK